MISEVLAVITMLLLTDVQMSFFPRFVFVYTLQSGISPEQGESEDGGG